MPLSAHAKDRVRLLLASIGLTIVALLVFGATFVLVPGRYLDRFFSKRGHFAFMTIIFVGACLKTYWRAWKHLRFWAILFAIFVIHFLGLGYFFYTGEGLPLMLFGPIMALEWGLLALAVYHVLGIGPQLGKHRGEPPRGCH